MMPRGAITPIYRYICCQYDMAIRHADIHIIIATQYTDIITADMKIHGLERQLLLLHITQ